MSARFSVILVAGLALLALIVLLGTFFTVPQTAQAIVLRLGKPIRVIEAPGLKVKTPIIDDVVEYDRRVLDFELPAVKVLAADQKQMIVDTYARFRIINPLLFYQTVRTETAARARLGAIINDRLRRFVAGFDLIAVVSDKRSSIMQEIRADTDREAKGFGIDVIDVRIRRADLPEDNSKAIYDRMTAERQRDAKQLRAQGAQQAQAITADADRQVIEIRADAQKQAQILRGQGDADSIRIYADAFSKDKDFFAFYRSLQAYREALSGTGTTFVLSPDSEFFRYLEAAPRPGAGAGTR